MVCLAQQASDRWLADELFRSVSPHHRDGGSHYRLCPAFERHTVNDWRNPGGHALGVFAGLGSDELAVLAGFFYIILGMFMDAMSMLVLTVPIAVPMVTALGVDPVWFGIFVVVMCEIGLITPPVGMNLFVVQGIRKDSGSFSDVVYGSLPFVVIMILFAGLLILWPELALMMTTSGGAR